MWPAPVENAVVVCLVGYADKTFILPIWIVWLCAQNTVTPFTYARHGLNVQSHCKPAVADIGCLVANKL